jgi:pilus assembly protein CpaE
MPLNGEDTGKPMDIRLNVLLVSRRKDTLDSLESILRKYPGLRLERRLTVNGHVDPLHDVPQLPDALILHLGETSHAELDSLAARAVDRRPPLIVLGQESDTTVLRLAMQAGARDLLPLPLVEEDLIAALRRIERDHRAGGARPDGALLAFMNAKGGSGATVLACNVAHALTTVSHRRVTLIDLDLQFGTLPVYFDLFPKRGMLQALENVAGLDELAFNGYLVQHASGLKILGHAAEDALPTYTVGAQQVSQLLNLAAKTSDNVVIDLPRRIDSVNAHVIERAHHLALVVQQSVATLRDATRLITCLRSDLGIARDRIVVVVNRYDKSAGVTAEDIRTTLGCGELSLIPNDFETVSACVDTGIPLLERARNAAVTRAVVTLQSRLGGSEVEHQGLLARTFSGILKSRSP